MAAILLLRWQLHAGDYLYAAGHIGESSDARPDTNTHLLPTIMTTFKNTVLYTDQDGFAKFREEEIALPDGSPKAMLSELFPSSGFQVRHSPPGISSDFHCTTTAQWLVVLSGEMEIGLRDGSARIFKAGDHFFSNDLLPEGAVFDSTVHGHRSRVVGDSPLATLFVRTGA